MKGKVRRKVIKDQLRATSRMEQEEKKQELARETRQQDNFKEQ